MAFNPFKSKPPVDKPSRNAFDLSFANNLTMEFGKLYPVFCKECLPGDTFKIDPTFAFKFMPMYFPVQSRMRADLKFFYVRNRNLWANWKKFIGQTDRITGQEVIPPYLKITPENSYRLATRSLLDYLGVPTTAPQLINSRTSFSLGGYSSEYANEVLTNMFPVNNNASSSPSASSLYFANHPYPKFRYQLNYYDSDLGKYYLVSHVNTGFNGIIPNNSVLELPFVDKLDNAGNSIFNEQFDIDEKGYIYFYRKARPGDTSEEGDFVVDDFRLVGSCSLNFSRENDMLQSSAIIQVDVPDRSPMSIEELTTLFHESNEDLYISIALPYKKDYLFQETDGRKNPGVYLVYPFAISFFVNEVVDSEPIANKNPFITQTGAQEPQIMLSALSCRAYEACFNSFYRNVEVDPFRINGQIEYDKFVPNDGDGADDYPYDFHYQYWEHDFLTDSVPSPQQGIAPLVGGRPAQTLAYDIKNDVGENYRVYATNDGVGTLLGLAGYTNTLKEGEQFAPQSTIDALQEAITFGISINDFRNVNALQKWLEKNIRRGYRYKDQMLSHFGVTLSYEECDMPEYLGGVSEDVNVRAISSTVETENAPLGSYAGQATCQGSSKHTINKYTDEHGFIIGILCVTPIPTYSQLLPKHFTKFSPFDFFSPEFGHIGLQPIPMKEVAPLNVALEDGNQEETFGYQRAFYDYLQSTDEVHGEFRASLQDYLVDRVFEGVPRLSKEFLEVDPAQVNDVFNYTGGDDKILGQIWFDCEVVRPIPKYGVPKIAD